MKRKAIPTILLLFFLSLFTAFGQEVTVSDARFCKGDDPAFSAPGYDDATWPVLSLEKDWTKQGIANAYGYGWYRIHVVIPSSLKKGAADKVVLDLGPIDDNDETWFNGRFAGKTDGWNKPRRYLVDAKSVNWDKENVIAVRVYNGGEPGGFYEGPARIGKPVLSDFVSMSLTGGKGACKMTLQSAVKSSGTVNMKVINPLTGETENAQMRPVRLSPKQPVTLSWPTEEQRIVSVTYRDDKIDGTLAASYEVPYILTPPAPASPRYNGPLVFGVRPGSPVIFRLAFSGERPMKFAVEGLPAGVKLDAEQGVLSGSVKEKGDYPLVLVATNAHGEVRQDFTLKVGDKIALTPPMGWNSWNCWGLSVSQEKVMSSAAALINRGLADYGYAYINVDDAWEAEERAADGRIVCNEKFPDMKGLGDWLHGNGLKLGIYSSPGDRTCGGYLGSIDHEKQDAETWNEWGVDYLKYDWCGYSKVFNAQNDRSVSSYIRPYLKMQEFLRQQPRDIFYSLCQYGMANVWTWGPFVDANSWRTTGDITDTWQSLYRIGFELQPELYPYAGPGHWNDPDMLVVGKVGWSNNLRDSRLTPDEQYTHITLWSLLAANMLIGCDIAQIDDFTFNLLCNNEVNAVNQDVLGVQAHRDIDEDGVQIWSRPLADGSTAIGIFNLNDQPVPVNIAGALGKLGLAVPATVRDLWRQQDIAPETYVIPRHGVRFIKYCAPQPKEPDPKYIVQISVGHWKAPTFSAEQIIARLDTVSRLIPIEKVIIGWSLDKDLYKKVGAYLHEKDIHMLLWLPVFAETEGVLDNSPAVDLWGQLPAEYAAGGFRFNCPTDPHNLANVVSLYDKCFSDCGFDGVFLDRVRTQSFVSGVGGVLNCGCPICAAHYAAEGVDLAEVRKAWEQKGDDFLSVSNYDPVTGFEFADPLAADFFRAKGHIVSNSVAAVCDSFHHRGLEVGLDLYAPFMAPFVGQDYDILSRHADFIKPMLYRMTFAPAGMGYEYDLLRKAIPGAKGYPDLKMDVAFLESQLEAMADCPCAKYPGIEINYRADIVPTSPEYVAESLAAVMRYHFDGLDLSWNIMEAPDAHIACLGK